MNNVHGISSIGNYYIMTAGHCGSTVWHEGTYSGPGIGSSRFNHYYNNTNCDCQATGPVTAGQGTNNIYLSPTTSRSITSVITRYQGQDVCYTGASTPTNPPKCGEAWEYPYEVVYPSPTGNILVTGLWMALYSKTAPGDSGAPVYYGSGGAGLVSGASTNYDRWYYTPLSTALNEMNLTLLTYTP